MRQKAVVLSVNENKRAMIEVSRAAMCDGCHKSGDCGGGCAIVGLVSNGNKMQAEAVNLVSAEVGDVVEVETESKLVLAYAALVFILPIFVCALFYFIGTFFRAAEWIPYLWAAVGFVMSFAAIAIWDKCARKTRCDIRIVNIIEKSNNE